jgi:hypothetical protein
VSALIDAASLIFEAAVDGLGRGRQIPSRLPETPFRWCWCILTLKVKYFPITQYLPCLTLLDSANHQPPLVFTRRAHGEESSSMYGRSMIDPSCSFMFMFQKRCMLTSRVSLAPWDSCMLDIRPRTVISNVLENKSVLPFGNIYCSGYLFIRIDVECMSITLSNRIFSRQPHGVATRH